MQQVTIPTRKRRRDIRRTESRRKREIT